MNKSLISGILIVTLGLSLLFFITYQTIFGNTKNGSDQTSTAYSLAENMTINTSSVPIAVIKGTTDQIELVVTSKRKTAKNLIQYVKVTEENNELNIKVSSPDQFFQLLTTKGISLQVFIPPSQLNKLSIISKSGKVTLEDIQADELNIITTSGKVTVDNIISKQYNTKTTSGKIEMTNITAHRMKTTSTSGKITINQLQSEELTLSSTSGNVIIHTFNVDRIHANVTSARFFADSGSGAFHIVTTSGKVGIEDTIILANSTLKSISGNIEMKMARQPMSLLISHRTATGASKIKHRSFKETSTNNPRVTEGQFGDGDIKLEVETTSGNFVLR